MTTFTFTSRETYLIWRKQWKTEYELISKKQREYKSAIKISMINGELNTWRHQHSLVIGKNCATSKLQELAEAKLEAQRQYLASH